MKRRIHKPFKYVPAIATDIRKTFAKVRKQLRERDCSNREKRV